MTGARGGTGTGTYGTGIMVGTMGTPLVVDGAGDHCLPKRDHQPCLFACLVSTQMTLRAFTLVKVFNGLTDKGAACSLSFLLFGWGGARVSVIRLSDKEDGLHLTIAARGVSTLFLLQKERVPNAIIVWRARQVRGQGWHVDKNSR